MSRTLPAPVADVWRLLTSDRGLAVWLGPGPDLPREKGARYERADGTTGEVRSFREHDRVRLTCRPPGWEHESTVQVAVTGRGDRTTVRFHQERLASAAERERQRTHWQRVVERLAQELDDSRRPGTG